MRDVFGRFVKGHIQETPRTEKQRQTALSNLSGFIGNGKQRIGKKHSESAKKKMSIAHKKRIRQMTQDERSKRFGIWKDKYGSEHPNYIEDRSLLKKDNRRNDSMYKEWRKNVYRRDNFKCRIDNENCDGRIESHHILCWKEYPELRYQTNNGITLCHAHHPRIRAEEKRLIPVLQELVSVLNA